MNKEEANDQLLKALSELEKLHPKKIDLGLRYFINEKIN